MAVPEEKRKKKELGDSSWILDSCAPGDLLFFARTSEAAGDFEAAVLTAKTTDQNLFHVGIVVRLPSEKSDRQLGIVHASTKGVKCDSFAEMIENVEPDEIQVYAVEASESDKLRASEFALTKVGCPYNDIFSPECKDSKGSEAYYCSQLVTKAYKGVDIGIPSHKMKFGSKDGVVPPVWDAYFKKLGCTAPVGEEGSHPTQLALATGITLKITRTIVMVFSEGE